MAYSHLCAYLQETCYWAARKSALNSSGHSSISDFFQIAIAHLSKILKAFNPEHSSHLKSYAELSFERIIRDVLRVRRETDICSDWSLLHKGKGDYIFPQEGAQPYKRDLNNIEFHILDTGHFALEEDLDFIATRIRDFVRRNVSN